MDARLGCLAIAVAACGGSYGGKGPAHPVAKASHRGIEDAALPYQVVDARTGHQLDLAAFWDKLAAQRAVCVGEEHPNPHHHWVQLEVVRQLAKRWPHFALGMEMVQRPFQGVLDDFAAGHIDEAALRSRTGWEDRWGYDYAFYGPTIRAAVASHAALLALNASRELTKKVAHRGLEGLSPEERQHVPELDLGNAAHRAWFDALMEGMGGSEAHGHKSEPAKTEKPDKPAPDDKATPLDERGTDSIPSADQIYAVQVIWDETMADTTAKWLAANPQGHVVILAGTGHCHDSAIVTRLQRRGIKDVVSVRPVIDDGQGGVAEVLAKPMNDLIVVLELPEDMKAALKEQDR